MKVDYTGRHTEVTEPLRRLTERKLAKLGKVLPGITHVHVVFAVDRHSHLAEITVHSPHLDLAATDESGELATALSTVMDKLVRQAQKHVGKIRQRKRRTGARPEALWSGVLSASQVPGDGEGARVVRSRRFVAKPMTVDEAVLEVTSGGDGVVVFRDAATERVNVLYKRRDGNLGLIEPEA
jgi:putative sigma-54 modulation protein